MMMAAILKIHGSRLMEIKMEFPKATILMKTVIC